MNNFNRLTLALTTLTIIGLAGLLWSTLGVDHKAQLDSLTASPQPSSTIGQMWQQVKRVTMPKPAPVITPDMADITPTPNTVPSNHSVNPLDSLTPEQLNHVPTKEERAQALAKIQWPPDDTIDWQARAIYKEKFGVDVTESPVPVWLPEPGEFEEVSWFADDEQSFTWYRISFQIKVRQIEHQIGLGAGLHTQITPPVALRSASLQNPDVITGEEGIRASWTAPYLVGDILVACHAESDKCMTKEEVRQYTQQLTYLGGKGH